MKIMEPKKTKKSPKTLPPNIYKRTLANGAVHYYPRFKFNGQEYRFPSFPTIKEAVAVLEEERSRLRANPKAKVQRGKTLISTLIKDHLIQNLHIKDQASQIRFGSFWNDYFENRLVESITVDEIEAARRYLLGSGRFEKRAHSTVNRNMAFLGKIFNEHERRMIYQDRPFRNPLKVVKKFKEAAPKENHILKEEEIAIKNYLSPEDGRAMDIAILTGMRQKEQFKLTWSQIDFGQKRILLPKTKANKLQSIPLGRKALQLFQDIKAEGRSAKYVFPSQTNPERHVAPRRIYDRFLKAVQAAGLTERGLVWHSTRDTFATRLLEGGANLYDVIKLGRWSDVGNIVNRYAHLSQDHLREVIDRVSVESSGPKGAIKGQRSKIRTNILRFEKLKVK
jgi:integrase